MNAELFDLAAKFRSADDAHSAAEAAYIEAREAMKAAYGARNEARDRLDKAIGNIIEAYKVVGL